MIEWFMEGKRGLPMGDGMGAGLTLRVNPMVAPYGGTGSGNDGGREAGDQCV